LNKKGVLLVNLGTPDSPEVGDVRKYLREFLMDKRVIDRPFWLRWILINLIIAPFRAPKSAKIYKKLWTERGSPLKFYGYDVEEKLQAIMPKDVIVKLAMRYQSPSIETGLNELLKSGATELIIVPMFPQYASASTGSVYEHIMKIASKWQNIPAIKFINNYYNHRGVIETFADNARALMAVNQYDHVVFSYHGIPVQHLTKGSKDCKLGSCCAVVTSQNHLCYRAQCFETTRLLVKELGLKDGTYTTTFQSRLGREKWVEPYTDNVIEQLAKEGKKSVLAFSPAFVADCLETTIEVADEYHELFIENGGERWDLVPSLNVSDKWIAALKDIALN
jgi:protoporphyrin/coproporphyrin ferrochelatase